MSNEILLKPPFSNEAEQALIGCLMIDEESIMVATEIINPDDFYTRPHREIYRAILKCDELNESIDPISISHFLEKEGLLDDVGGWSYLADLAATTPSAVNVKTYAKIIKDRSLERKLIKVANKVSQIAFTGEESAQEKIDIAGGLLSTLMDNEKTSGPQKVSTCLPAWLEGLEARFENGGALPGLSVGLIDVDNITAGLQKSDLIILAGRPSMGKTALALNVAENVAVKQGISTAFFSLEMPAEQLINRMVSSLAGVDQSNIQIGNIEDYQWDKITSAVTRVNNSPLFIDETGGLTLTALRSRARRLKKHENIQLIIVDYIQLMRHDGFKSRYEEVSEISRMLKALAKELNIPVIVLSQLNRAVEGRPNKRPLMSDLRESGGLEQDADVIAFVYRDEVYDEESDDKGTAELIFRKQRNREIGSVRLVFNKHLSRFDNFRQEYASNPWE